jgi:DNA-binding IclR family transcriptional regulator
MEDIGVIARRMRGQYRPGMLLLSLSSSVPVLELLRNASESILKHLASSFNLTTHLAILQNDMVTYVRKHSPTGGFPVHTRVGTQLEAYSSGLGKVLLAGLNTAAVERFIMSGDLVALTPFTITSPLRLREELATVRERGFAIDNRETHIKTRCVAVPVHDRYGKTIAAVSASDEASRMTPSREAEIQRALFEAAVELQTALYRRRTVRDRSSKALGRGAAKSRVKSRTAESRDLLILHEPGQAH